MVTETEPQTVEQLLNNLLAQRDEFLEKVTEAENGIKAARKVLGLLQGQAGGKWTANGITSHDLEHCGTQHEALLKIAQLSEGVIKVRHAADLIREAGLSKGKKASTQSTLHNLLSKRPEWDYVEPGVFRLVHQDESEVTPEVSNRLLLPPADRKAT